MPISRRTFLAATAVALPTLSGSKAAAEAAPQAGRGAAQAPLRVQFTAGGHTIPLFAITMFDDPTFQDFDTVVLSHPNPFRNLNGSPGQPGPEVVVLYDSFGGGWPAETHEPWMQYLNAGKGVVVLHHALDDNNNGWPYWHEEVLGGYQNMPGQPTAKTSSRLKSFPTQKLTPVGNHPIVRDMRPFTLSRDEVFPNMGFSPKITTIVETDDPDSATKTSVWIGIHPKARVVCCEPGHTPSACADPRYRKLVHNMIAWAGGRLT